MNFIDVQGTVRNLIAAHPTFAGGVVIEDMGNGKAVIEDALDLSPNDGVPGPGWAVSIWPPAHGHSDSEVAGSSGVECTIIARLQYNPKFLNANLVTKGSKYSTFPGPSGCHFDIAVTPGVSYVFVMGSSIGGDDLGLQNGTQHLAVSGTFVANGNLVNLLGGSNDLVGSQLYPDPGQVVNGMIKDLIGAVIEADPDNGGVRFALSSDCFELVTFDEGLVAYHIRFNRFAVFGL
jgi:hypothetical protein